jgi:hypothetical protein
MDNKRVLLAVVLSLAVLIGWNLLFPPAPPVHQKQIKNATTRQPQNSVSTTVSTTAQSQSPAQTKSKSILMTKKFDLAKGQKITIETALVTPQSRLKRLPKAKTSLKRAKHLLQEIADTLENTELQKSLLTASPFAIELAEHPDDLNTPMTAGN